MEPAEPTETPRREEATARAAARPPLKERLKLLMTEYGRLAIWVYFGIFFACLGGFAVALKMGLDVEGAGGTTGTLVGAYAATKLTQPLRILLTLALTPLLERVLRVWPRLHRWLMGA